MLIRKASFAANGLVLSKKNNTADRHKGHARRGLQVFLSSLLFSFARQAVLLKKMPR